MTAFELCHIPFKLLEPRASTARLAGAHTLIGALVKDPDGRLFSQRRSLTRRFGPGLWDNVGGHVEDGETLFDALSREIGEETGWVLDTINFCAAIRHWDDDRGPSEEYIVICTVNGDLDHPVLEDGKVDQTAWIGPDNLNVLNENRSGDTSQYEIYKHALSCLL